MTTGPGRTGRETFYHLLEVEEGRAPGVWRVVHGKCASSREQIRLGPREGEDVAGAGTPRTVEAHPRCVDGDPSKGFYLLFWDEHTELPQSLWGPGPLPPRPPDRDGVDRGNGAGDSETSDLKVPW